MAAPIFSSMVQGKVVQTWPLLDPLKDPKVSVIGFTASQALVVLKRAQQFAVFYVISRQKVTKIKVTDPLTHKHLISIMGDRLIYYRGKRGVVEVFDLKGKRAVATIRCTSTPLCLTLLKKWVVVCLPTNLPKISELYAWDLEGQPVRDSSLCIFPSGIKHWTGDGTYCVAACSGWTIACFGPHPTKRRFFQPPNLDWKEEEASEDSMLLSLAVSARHLVSSDLDGNVYCWNIKSTKCLWTTQSVHLFKQMTIQPGTSLLFAVSTLQDIIVWDLCERKPRASLQWQKTGFLPITPKCMSSHEGKILVFHEERPSAVLWRLPQREESGQQLVDHDPSR